MNDDQQRPTLSERIIAARQTDDLSLDMERRRDADYLMASALAAQRLGRAGQAVAQSALNGRPEGMRSAMRATRDLTVRLNAKRRWRLSAQNCERVAALALQHYVDPVCPHCHGRLYEQVPGTPHLSARPCGHCGGSGERRIQDRWHESIRDVLEALRRADGLAAAGAAELLR